MAVLNATQLAVLRRQIVNGGGTVDFTKAQLNAPIQALEDWFETNKAAALVAMDNAGNAAGKDFNNAQLKVIANAWLSYKFGVGVL